jgi:hypothetical protein
LFDEKLNVVVTTEFVGRSSYTVYSDFGAGKVYITVTDRNQDLSFIFDGQGKLVTTLPLESYAIALRPLDSDGVKAYSIFENALTTQPLRTDSD